MDRISQQLDRILKVLYSLDEKAVPAREVLTVPQAAEYLGLSEYTLREWCRLRKIPHHKVNGQLRFKKSKLDKWLDRNEISIMQ